MGPHGSLGGKIVLVTGATGALGRVVVKRLLGSGAAVAAAYRDEAKFQEILDLVDQAVRDLLTGFKADVTSEAEVRAMVEGTLSRHGRIDALLNLVGTYRGGADIAATGEDEWDLLMRTNLKSAFLCSRAVLPAMTKAGAGRIVCVSARPAVENKGRAKSGAYAVSKAGVVALVQAIAEETRKLGITANCIVPGTIDTPNNRAEIPGGDFSKWADPEAVAEVLLFLVSDASAVTSGAVVPVYGKS
ncbi:MAG TPA: SDR family NAD(P)-dependent oxidoreductase [Acidobacteriota bacterium]|nr:SDR family NAD(P)-dependent oxidoreductase [Acidobacteriota bacterium]